MEAKRAESEIVEAVVAAGARSLDSRIPRLAIGLVAGPTREYEGLSRRSIQPLPAA